MKLSVFEFVEYSHVMVITLKYSIYFTLLRLYYNLDPIKMNS